MWSSGGTCRQDTRDGGPATGGINFDAKLRRESTSLVDLFYGHISGMDALARGLRNAAKMLEVRSQSQIPAPQHTSTY